MPSRPHLAFPRVAKCSKLCCWIIDSLSNLIKSWVDSNALDVLRKSSTCHQTSFYILYSTFKTLHFSDPCRNLRSESAHSIRLPLASFAILNAATLRRSLTQNRITWNRKKNNNHRKLVQNWGKALNRPNDWIQQDIYWEVKRATFSQLARQRRRAKAPEKPHVPDSSKLRGRERNSIRSL